MSFKIAKSATSGAAEGRAVLRCHLRATVKDFRVGWLNVCSGGIADIKLDLENYNL